MVFMMPPTPNNKTKTQIFSNHSKTNSVNNSVGSYQNMRYSQQDEEEDDQFYDYDNLNLETNHELCNTSAQVIEVQQKISLGSIEAARNSVFSHRSTSNCRKNRYDEDNGNDDDDEFDHNKDTSPN